MKKELLVFFNKRTYKKIGFHHPTLFVVSDITDAYIYDRRVINAELFIQLFTKCNSNANKDVFRIHNKYFSNIDKNDISYVYIDYDTFIRKYKIEKIKLKINEILL